MRSVRFERLDAQRMAAVVLEMAGEERMRLGDDADRVLREDDGRLQLRATSSESSCIAPLRMMPLPAAMTGDRASISRFA